MMRRTLVIRADASIATGTGHVMRCLALAQAWQDVGGDVFFVTAAPTCALEQRLRGEGINVFAIHAPAGSVEDAKETRSICDRTSAEWVVVDGYHFDWNYQRQFKSAGLKVLLIDDYGRATNYGADVLLNHNVNATETNYGNCDAKTKLLLGTSYTLLRREFRNSAVGDRDVPGLARKILVTFGGSDPHDVTTLVLRALGRVEYPLIIEVVVGSSHPNVGGLQKLTSHLPNVHLQANVANMSKLMASADLAVTAGGITCYELALMRVPMVLITMADNHAATCSTLERFGAALHLGWFNVLGVSQIAKNLADLIVDPDRRSKLIANASRLVDGKGPARVVNEMLVDDGGAFDESRSEKHYAVSN